MENPTIQPTPSARHADQIEQLKTTLRARIESGDLKGRLPGERMLANEYNASISAARKAIYALTEEGLIYSKPRSGSYVSGNTHKNITTSPVTISAALNGSLGFLQSRILQGIQQAAQPSDTRVMLGGNLEGKDFPQAKAIEAAVRVDHCDGVVLWPAYDELGTCPVVQTLTNKNIQFCCVFGVDTRKKQPFSYVTSDDISGGYLATKHLIETGRKNIGFLIPKLSSFSRSAAYMERRREGYMRALWENNSSIPPMITVPWDDGTQLWDQTDEDKLFESIKGFDALFCAFNDEIAAEAIRMLTLRGVRVPEDIAVIGYNNSLIAQSAGITSVEQHPNCVGSHATTILLDLLQGKTDEPIQKIIQPDLVVRESSLNKRKGDIS